MRSSLEVYDIASGRCRVVCRSDDLIEAPNWHPGGRRLLINCDGRLAWVDLATGRRQGVETGPAVACNNDHGLSPDGGTIALSDKAQTGASCIFTVPVAGGVPRRVTSAVPSYWHGWSPDGARLAYVARRARGFQIATISVAGGPERILTDAQGHHDGPDYTPDGAWIWFNSDRGGKMALWRMRPDGSDPQAMTDDDRSNWFPHPSPDGRQVVYLAYPPGTEGHPRDRDVELRAIGAEGGDARVLVRLFGGQGTINVPSWAPDASAFAFVRYTPAPGGRP